MVVMSKQVFDSVVEDQTCCQLFHPWSKTCLGAMPKVAADSCKGSLHFYSIVYLAQLAVHAKSLKSKKMWVKMGQYYCRSLVFGFVVPFSFVTMNCIIRSLLGIKISYYTALAFPLATSGLAIYLEPPSRRGLVINLFVNQLVEYCIRSLSRANYINITKTKQVLMFMIGSSLLFYLMRLEGDKEQRTSLFWLYIAEKVNKKTDDSENVCPPEDTDNVCPHKGPCRKYILKGCGTYFGIGLAISMAKLILPRIRSPLRALASIRSRQFKMALFFGSYIGIYRSVMCYLCRRTGEDSAMYALPAGFLSGLSMVFNPSLGLSIASITGAMKLYTTILYEKKLIPDNIPLPELIYCFCQGVLFSARFVDPQTCPPYIMNLTDTISHGHCEAMYRRAVELAQKKFPSI